MARHDHNHLQVPEMDHTQPRNSPRHEALPLGHKLTVHTGIDTPLRIGHSGHGGMSSRSHDLPSSSQAAHYPGQRVGNPWTSHVSFAPYTNASSSCQLPDGTQAHPEVAFSYPYRPEECFAAMSSDADNRRASMKRKNPTPVTDPLQPHMLASTDPINWNDHQHKENPTSVTEPLQPYMLASIDPSNWSDHQHRVNPTPVTEPLQPYMFASIEPSNWNDHQHRVNPTPVTEPLQPYMFASIEPSNWIDHQHRVNPTPVTEPLQPHMIASIGPSNWNDDQLVNQGGSQRNVRARRGSTYQSSNVHLLPFHSTASAFVSTSAERNQEPFAPTRTTPSGANGITDMASTGRQYHSSMHSSTAGVVTAPTVHGSSDDMIFSNGGYVSRAVHGQAVPGYIHPSFVASSSSGAIPRETVIPNYPPALTSMRINRPSPIGASTSSRQARRASIRHTSSTRNRRAMNSFHPFHPMMAEAQHFMMLDHLAMYESRQAAADPHRNLRLDIDAMSYEELLALGERIGTVNTGVADENIAGCVKEVVCCSSEQTQKDEDDGSCVVCLEEYKDNDSLGILKCGHDFHSDCIKKWLQVKNACPVCKSAVA